MGKQFKIVTAYTDETPVVASNSSQMLESNKSAEEFIAKALSVPAGLPDDSAHMRVSVVIGCVNELQSRITQLEKQNSELREALTKVCASYRESCTSTGLYLLVIKAEQALKPKDNG